MLRGPGGVWTIGQGNRFDLVAEAPEWSGCDTFFWDGTGSGVRPLGQVTVSWWEVRSGPLAVQSRAFNDLNAVVGFVADVVEAMVGANHPTASALRAKSLDARNDIEAIVRLVNLSSVGVFVERIWGGR
jgi:hypothetical protein